MRDLHNDVKYSRAISPVAATTNNDAWTSEILDTASFAHNELIIASGSLADIDATFTLLIEDGDSDSLADAAAVADAYLLGTEAASGFTYADDNEVHKIGYRGIKRYIRATITPANNTGNAFISAVWAQSGARKAPQS